MKVRNVLNNRNGLMPLETLTRTCGSLKVRGWSSAVHSTDVRGGKNQGRIGQAGLQADQPVVRVEPDLRQRTVRTCPSALAAGPGGSRLSLAAG